MDWTIIERITEHPVFISIVSIFSIGGFALIVLNKTSFGKKAIDGLTKLVDNGAQRITGIKKIADETLDKVNEVKETALKTKEEVEIRFKSYFSQLEFFESAVFNILKEIPNAKVQAQVTAFEKQWVSKKKEIIDYVGSSYSELNEDLKELKDEKEREIATLKGEIEELKDLFNKTLKVAEVGENEQREEGIDTQATKE